MSGSLFFSVARPELLPDLPQLQHLFQFRDLCLQAGHLLAQLFFLRVRSFGRPAR